MMVRILFVCHGNICRSPMAEFLMRHLAEKNVHGIITNHPDRCREVLRSLA